MNWNSKKTTRQIYLRLFLGIDNCDWITSLTNGSSNGTQWIL